MTFPEVDIKWEGEDMEAGEIIKRNKISQKTLFDNFEFVRKG